MAQKDELIGMQLDEYRLEAALGQGGMARVYLGLDVNLLRYAAIKVIASSYSQEDGYKQRFESEARAIAQLEHPHIVRLYRYGEACGVLFMAMQYIEGCDLGSVLQSYRHSHDHMEANDIARIVREMALALDYVHSRGVIHRDVKSSNVMLDKTGRAILTDFGLALRLDTGTRGQVFGSPHYISPEQAFSSAKVVPQSDLYSLGVILYEMFTNRVPFDALDPLNLAMMHITQEPPRPIQFRPDLDPHVEAVILKTLAKQPEERYPNGAALADALDQALKLSYTSLDRPENVPPTRLTIPERVAHSMAERPLPPITSSITPPPQTQSLPAAAHQVTPATSANLAGAPRITPPQVAGPQPANFAPSAGLKDRKLLFALLAGIPLILAVFACLLVLAYSTSWLGARKAADSTQAPPLAAILTRTPALPISQNKATPTPVLTPTPSQITPPPSPSAAPSAYQITLARCRSNRCLAIINLGSIDFPLAPLKLAVKKDSIQGSDFDEVKILKPGQCALIAAEDSEDQGNSSLEGINCNLAGSPLKVDAKDFFKDDIVVYYANRALVNCGKSGCKLSIPIP